MIDPSRIQKARGFLHLGTKDGYDLVIESFTNLNAELQAEAINSTDHGGKGRSLPLCPDRGVDSFRDRQALGHFCET